MNAKQHRRVERLERRLRNEYRELLIGLFTELRDGVEDGEITTENLREQINEILESISNE